MSRSIRDAQSEWLAQLASMRAAIEQLKLDQTNDSQYSYTPDLILDDDDLTGDSESDGIWDVQGEDTGEEYSSDMLDEQAEVYLNGDGNNPSYGMDWIRTKTAALANRKQDLDVDELQEQTLALLGSDMNGLLQYPLTFLCSPSY